jgi:hypothetical protein
MCPIKVDVTLIVHAQREQEHAAITLSELQYGLERVVSERRDVGSFDFADGRPEISATREALCLCGGDCKEIGFRLGYLKRMESCLGPGKGGGLT